MPVPRYLVVTNAYPSESALYANAFIHPRVKAYLAAGLDVSVVVLRPTSSESVHYEFDGVAVDRVGAEPFAEMVRTGGYTKFLVHFPLPHMLKPIAEHAPSTPVIAWVHGYETEKWYRRWFNLVDDPAAIREALSRRESHSQPQLDFMRWLFTTEDLDVTIVQVSDWFREHVSEPDVGARARRCVVIPNPIDTDLFAFRDKPAELRTRILSIRPYASQKYANDQTVRAIELLQRDECFPRLQFSLYGAGPLWESTTAPLRGLPNVTLTKGFLRQRDIAALHAEHGVFLAPTRFDSQGVSMCEAMSSGLVPVSTRISAIPEFVEDGVSGLLAEPESPEGLARHIGELFRDPQRFTTLAGRAAADIRRRCGAEATTDKELELIES